MWLQITYRKACFGIREEDGVIVEAAPIARWTLGKTKREVVKYFRRKGGRVRYLDQDAEPPVRGRTVR